jgi:hypothetical protein
MESPLDFSLTLLRAEVAHEGDLAHRPLFDGAPADVPVIALLADGDPITTTELQALEVDIDDVFVEALETLEDRDAGWIEQSIPVKGGAVLRLAARAGEEAEAVELLRPDELEAAAELLGAKALAVAIPSSGSLLVTDADQKWQLVATFAAAARMRHDEAADEALWPGVLRVEDGKITGVIDLRTASLDAASRR